VQLRPPLQLAQISHTLRFGDSSTSGIHNLIKGNGHDSALNYTGSKNRQSLVWSRARGLAWRISSQHAVVAVSPQGLKFIDGLNLAGP
jgi:hypothetical protein